MVIQNSIEQKLQRAFSPSVLEIINESHMHNVPQNAETHFKVTIVSEVFTGLSKVKRQQAIYKQLAEELAGEVHALTMQTFTPAEWATDPQRSQSPPCLGGER